MKINSFDLATYMTCTFPCLSHAIFCWQTWYLPLLRGEKAPVEQILTCISSCEWVCAFKTTSSCECLCVCVCLLELSCLFALLRRRRRRRGVWVLITTLIYQRKISVKILFVAALRLPKVPMSDWRERQWVTEESACRASARPLFLSPCLSFRLPICK